MAPIMSFGIYLWFPEYLSNSISSRVTFYFWPARWRIQDGDLLFKYDWELKWNREFLYHRHLSEWGY